MDPEDVDDVVVFDCVEPGNCDMLCYDCEKGPWCWDSESAETQP